MIKSTSIRLLLSGLLLLLVGCSSENFELAPDNAVGLKSAYMVGSWCTNRDLTAQTNKDAGGSALTNISKRFWRFRESGKWENSTSGWMYTYFGKWRLEGANTMLLSQRNAKPGRYAANFENNGNDLFLEDEEGQFLVLSRCD